MKNLARSTLMTALLLTSSSCWVDVDLDGQWACQKDGHCIEGYTCTGGYCQAQTSGSGDSDTAQQGDSGGQNPGDDDSGSGTQCDDNSACSASQSCLAYGTPKVSYCSSHCQTNADCQKNIYWSDDKTYFIDCYTANCLCVGSQGSLGACRPDCSESGASTCSALLLTDNQCTDTLNYSTEMANSVCLYQGLTPTNPASH